MFDEIIITLKFHNNLYYYILIGVRHLQEIKKQRGGLL